jgi:hypothetical protein
MKAYSIKKIINKKVTFSSLNRRIPLKNRYSPIYDIKPAHLDLFLTLNNKFIMKNRDYRLRHHREHHPQVSIGLFFIVLGLALLVATNDMLHLGSVKEYFTWETVMIFVGVLLLLNLQFIGGILLIAGGGWFLMDNFYGEIPQLIKIMYWPAVIIVLGISFIISSLVKRNRYQ